MQMPSHKANILEQIRATHQPLEALLASLSESQLTQRGVNGDWSVKDMLAHITWWEQHLLRRLRTGQEDLYGDGVDPKSATDRANAEVFAANQSRPLADVLAEFAASYRETLTTLEGMPEEELAQGAIQEAIAWDTFRHYPEHTEMLQAWITSGATQAE